MLIRKDALIELAASTDETRYVLCAPYLDGNKIVATDGRIMASVAVEREEGDLDGAVTPDEIIVNGENVAKLGPMYGYGDYYLQAAFEWLDANGYTNRHKAANGSSDAPWGYCKDRGIVLSYSAADVRRERDL